MKDLTFTLTAKRLRRESLHLLGCVALAETLNAYAIATRKTAWSELVTCLPFVLGLALVFYGLWSLVRLAGFGAKRLLAKRPNP